ncbi:hypothetical protein QCA50_019402 [Cerrena zonata]|uniref:Uncharacterized protein n=1 Tax=Cerrena zonata TaxID=2478898 RepID=A0AAW0FAX2_9APHY
MQFYGQISKGFIRCATSFNATVPAVTGSHCLSTQPLVTARPSSILPNLHHLTWLIHGIDEAWCSLSLINPLLENVSLSVDSCVSATDLNGIHAACWDALRIAANLRTATFDLYGDNDSDSDDDTDTTSQSACGVDVPLPPICSWNCLERFSHRFSISTDSLNHLSWLPDLKELNVTFEPRLSFETPSSKPFFPSLVVLVLIVPTVESLSVTISLIRRI